MTLDCEVVITRQGAKAIRDRTTGQLMHPVVGPAIEAQRLYIGPSRLEARLRGEGDALVLLDVGLGAASNAIAAWRLSESVRGRRLSIVSFDQSLAALELASTSEHASAFGLDGDAKDAVQAILDKGAYETEQTTWRLSLGDLRETMASEPPNQADVVFWDPFSPRANPELWTLASFSALFRLCREGATVHTYSGATAARSAMLLAGFAVGEGIDLGETKRATTAAMRLSDLERPLDRRWRERVARSSAALPPDAPNDALDQIAKLNQLK